jgi:acetylornithine deacetylase/succinyl-diaminopimelate desuccinylase-like protein
MTISSEDLQRSIQALMPAARDDLARLVAFKSVANEALYPLEECLAAARYTANALSEVGLGNVQLLDMPYGHPAVFAEAPGPAGAPTVLLYTHYDVQPPLGDEAWRTPPFDLTERDGRWFGRGAADCKGNFVMLLTALRALRGNLPVGIKVIIEGSEEQGLGELEDFVPEHPDLLRADAILICDTGNFEAGLPTITSSLRGVTSLTVTVRTLATPMHSGQFGGPAPDALVALVAMLATLHDAQGNTTVRGLSNGQRWPGVQYEADRFRRDAGVLDGVEVLEGDSVADLLWARPSLNILGIDCPRIAGSSNVLQAEATARLSLRVPPGMDVRQARAALAEHLRSVTPWGARVEIHEEGAGPPFQTRTDGTAFTAMRQAMQGAYGKPSVEQGAGGSIPLCSVFQSVYPDAEILLIGVEEPQCLIHAPNESVDPREIERTVLAVALFLDRFAASPA